MDAGARPPWEIGSSAKPAAAERAPRGRAPLRVAESGAGTAWGAEPAVIDAVDLLAEAARAGLDPARVAALRARLEGGTVATLAIERVERALRRWLSKQESAPALGVDAAGD